MKKLTKLQVNILLALNDLQKTSYTLIRDRLNRSESDIARDRQMVKSLIDQGFVKNLSKNDKFLDSVFEITPAGVEFLKSTRKICQICEKASNSLIKFKSQFLCRDCLIDEEPLVLEDFVYKSPEYQANFQHEGFQPTSTETIRFYTNLKKTYK